MALHIPRAKHAVTAGVVIFTTYALVQVTQVADATATFDIYDFDNHPQVSPQLICTGNCMSAGCKVMQNPHSVTVLNHLRLHLFASTQALMS